MVDTLGEAWKLGWKCSAHCLWFGPSKRGTRLLPYCDERFQLDVLTLVLTRGTRFPIANMNDVMRCPKCGLMRMRVFFSPPPMPRPQAIAVNDDD